MIINPALVQRVLTRMRPIFTVITDRSALAFGLKPNRTVPSYSKFLRFSDGSNWFWHVVNGTILDRLFVLFSSCNPGDVFRQENPRWFTRRFSPTSFNPNAPDLRRHHRSFSVLIRVKT